MTKRYAILIKDEYNWSVHGEYDTLTEARAAMLDALELAANRNVKLIKVLDYTISVYER